MGFHPFEVSIPHIFYACIGGFVVLFGMFSLFLREKLYIGEACWAFVFGVIIGPYGANIFDPRGWSGNSAHSEETANIIVLEVSRVVLAIGVFAIGVELPKAYMAKHWKSLFFLLGPVMTYGWFVSAGLIYALVPGLNFLSSLAVAACLTPTDPILAAAVVGGKYADKHVPAHLRHLLAAESGCNDGAAFPFLYIALYLIIDGNTGKAIRDWFLLLWLYQVVLGVVIGGGIGFGFRHLMKFCERRDLIDRHSYVAQYVSLALLTIGVTTLLGSDDLLSAFACGTAFAWDGFFNKQTEESLFSSVIDLLFNIAAFVFVGAWMPFSSFQDPELTLTVWRLIVIAILVLLLRRLPIMVLLYKWIPDIKTFREAIFSGHFGPIGVGAIFISTLAAELLREHVSEEPNEQTLLLSKSIQPITAFMVLCSISIHGLSIPAFSLGRRVHTVSRTWSRATGQPEWANQARMVERGGADIVINRDAVDEMERGDLQIEKLEETESGSENKLKDSEISEKTKVEDTDGPTGEVPPDGDDIVQEWQEGSHTIIERRAGPGEEVEVEVIRNHGKDDSASSKFRGSHASVHQQLHAYVDKVRDTWGPEVEKIEELIDRIGQARGVHHEDVVASPLHHEEHDDDEGWASDGSNAGPSTTSLSDRKARTRSKSPKTKSKHVIPKLGTPPPAHRSRKAQSMRRTLMSRLPDDTERGRLSISVDQPSSSGSSTPGGSIRNSTGGILSPSRDHSPTRSVHFIDQEERRNSSSTPLSPGELEDIDSARSKVTFELPPTPKH
ncbi:Sodium/hydrogen exchanger family-domain-containing protein [Mycena floridula]|nr:Sodium/hydrogen exchanger family-domain-containing protein [Mycena floridula]